MRADKPPLKSVHNVHTPFGRTNTQRVHSVWLAVSSHPTRIPKKTHLGHVVTTIRRHERVTAANWPPETARRDAT
jgi:hypothetical protein